MTAPFLLDEMSKESTCRARPFHICRAAVDFRKGINSLAALVSQALNANPYCGDVFIFRSKRMDRLKLLAWDGTGMVMMTKWLEESRFIWPPIRDGAVHLSATQMAMLVDGLDWTRAPPNIVKQPTGVM
jgi:transposase